MILFVLVFMFSCSGGSTLAPIPQEPILHATFERVATSQEFSFCFDGKKSTGERPFKSIVWDMGDGCKVTGQLKVTHNYDKVGYYPITLTLVEKDGDTDSFTMMYRINMT